MILENAGSTGQRHWQLLAVRALSNVACLHFRLPVCY